MIRATAALYSSRRMMHQVSLAWHDSHQCMRKLSPNCSLAQDRPVDCESEVPQSTPAQARGRLHYDLSHHPALRTNY